MRVLEIGGAPGAAARAVAERVGPHGHVRVVDRSAAGIRLVEANCAAEIAAGTVSVQTAEVQDFALPEGFVRFDPAFACRVGAPDGRHPERRDAALGCLREAVVPGGALYVDTGAPLTRITLS